MVCHMFIEPHNCIVGCILNFHLSISIITGCNGYMSKKALLFVQSPENSCKTNFLAGCFLVVQSPLFADSVLLPPENHAGKGVISSHVFPPLKQSRQPLGEWKLCEPNYLVAHPTARKWVITPVISGLTLLIPFITGIITHLLSGMSHQVLGKIWLYRTVLEVSYSHGYVSK